MQEKTEKKQKEIKRNEKSIKKSSKGITLIALVITIIVLLILAAVSIATLTGQNGILTRANDAKEQTGIAEEKEAIQLAYNGVMTENKGEGVTANQLEDELQNNGYSATATDGTDGEITVTFGAPSNRVYTIDANGNITGPGTSENPGGGQTGGVQPGEIVKTTVKDNYSDGENTATVPAGFVVSKIPEEQKVSTGLVIYDIPEEELAGVDWTTTNEDGAYQVQTLYNQFVWIPVRVGTYERDFSYPSSYYSTIDYTPGGSTYTDTGYLPEGIQGTDDAESNETAERNAVMKYNGFYIARYEAGRDGTTVISKQNAEVYTNITQTNSKSTAKTMYMGDSVKSALCSGIQWDMVMKFVDGKNDSKGNAYNVRVNDANRHTGSKTTAGKNEYDKVQNIYDLEGNCIEWVAEKNNLNYPSVNRGDNCNKGGRYGACLRHSLREDSYNHGSFRTTLYIM